MTQPLAPIPPPALTAEEEEFLRKKYQAILKLFDVSVWPDETKRAWVKLLPHMNMGQLDRLEAMLAKDLHTVLEEALNHPEDQRLIGLLNDAKKFHEEEVNHINERAMKELEIMEREMEKGPLEDVP